MPSSDENAPQTMLELELEENYLYDYPHDTTEKLGEPTIILFKFFQLELTTFFEKWTNLGKQIHTKIAWVYYWQLSMSLDSPSGLFAH